MVAAAVALWQANQYRSAVVGAAGGGTTVDPVVVAAPVLALLAGTALTLRLLPPGVRMAERVVTRSPGLTAPLAAWGLGRRAGTASVTALACVLTVGTAVLSLVFAASWGQLQGNRADGRVGADVRVVVTGDTPSQREVAPDGLASTYAALPGVQAVAPALRTSLRAGDAEAQVLAVDTRSARAAMTLPPETSGALASLGVPLAAPALDLPPGETLSATVEVVDGPSPDVIEAFIADIPPEFFEGDETLDPEEEARDFLRSTATFSVDLLLRDDDGLIRALPLGRSTARDGPRTFTARLPAAGPGRGRGYVLAGVEARFSTGVGGSTYNPSLVLGQLTVGAEPVDLDAEGVAGRPALPGPAGGPMNVAGTAVDVSLVARGVSRIFGSGATQVHALRSVDLQVGRGQLLAVRGRSGSGKTTLLNVLGGLDRPDSGTVHLGEREVSAMVESELVELRRTGIGFIFQSFGLLPILSAAENVGVPLRLIRTDPAERERRVAQLLDLVGLSNHAAQRPGELSGGQQQRVAVARALANDPELLIADEPTGQLDLHTGRAVLELIRALVRERGTTAVVATHDPALIDYADRVVDLQDGQIIGDSTTKPACGTAGDG